MFRDLTCPSSGGTTAQTQHLVSSLFYTGWKKVCFDFSTTLSETLFILRWNQWDVTIHVQRSSRKVSVNLVSFLMKLEFLDRSTNKILKYQISWKYIQWEPSFSIPTDRHYEANVHFSQFCESAWIQTCDLHHMYNEYSVQLTGFI